MNWTANVSDGSPWLVIQSGNTGTNNGLVTLAYESNISVERNASVIITAGGAKNSPVTVDVRQVSGDTDKDGLPDEWETGYFGNITAHNGTDDPDNDGVSNLDEYNAKTDPNVPNSTQTGDTDEDGLPDEWEIKYFGDITAHNGTDDPDNDGVSNLDEYNAGTDPKVLNSNQTGDTDEDGLPDEWEIKYFGDITAHNGTDDPDSDGVSNLDEYNAETDPNVPNSNQTGDSDEDGLPDIWETGYFGNITAYNGTDDPDNDGITNLDEYNAGTNPKVADSNQMDTDKDGMPDEWEKLYSLNPLANDASQDPDGDGLSNLKEYEIQSDPTAKNNGSVLTVSPEIRYIPSREYVIPVTVANAGSGVLNWTGTTDADWITLSPPSGTGDTLVNVKCKTNPGQKRTGTILIKAPCATGTPKKIQIVQSPAPDEIKTVTWEKTYFPDMNHTWYGIWGSPENKVFAVGQANGKGVISHFDGSAWAKMSVPDTDVLYDVSGNAADNVFAVGKNGTVLRFDGNNWTKMAGPFSGTLNAVWVSPTGKAVAVGVAGDAKTGKIYLFDGTIWKEVYQETGNIFRGVWGFSDTSILVAGQKGTLMKYDGSNWTKITTPTSHNLFAVWGNAENNIYAAGNFNVVLHSDGTDWQVIDNPLYGEDSAYRNIWGSSQGRPYFVDPNSNMFIPQYNGETWTHFGNSNIYLSIFDMWGRSENDYFMVGSDGMILRYLNPDSDADGLPDEWELAHFKDIESNSGNDDPDKDGISNLNEFLNGTDPMNGITPPVTGGDLAGHWKFDETQGTVAEDSSGNNRHGTVYSAVPADGMNGGALDFTGDGRRVTLPGTWATYAPDHFSVIMWINGSVIFLLF